jgi:hypothetical protein
MRMGRALLAALLVALPVAAGAQTDSLSRNTQNEGNDPLTPKAAIELQDYAQPVLNRQPGSGTNQGIVRGVLPHDALNWPQTMRASLPVVDTAYGPTGSITGLGDLTVYDIPLFFIDKAKFGVGPLLVAPTSTSRALGDGKWQGGAQAVASAPHDWGLTAGLVSYQKAFDGGAELINAQPLLFYNLGSGYYLRSSGLAAFDLVKHTSVIPLGLGLGRVFPLSNGRVINTFVEPQYSVLRVGDGVPTFQVFVGFNIQFPLGGSGR